MRQPQLSLYVNENDSRLTNFEEDFFIFWVLKFELLMSRLHVVKNILLNLFTLCKWIIYSYESIQNWCNCEELIIFFYCGIFQGQKLLDKVGSWIFFGSKFTNWMWKLFLSTARHLCSFFRGFWHIMTKNSTQIVLTICDIFERL